MPWDPLVKFLVDYFGKQPFQNLLTAALLGTIVWSIYDRRQQARESHTTFHQVLVERDANEKDRTELIVSALTGVKREIKANTVEAARTTAEVKKIPEAAAVAADLIIKKAESSKQGE